MLTIQLIKQKYKSASLKVAGIYTVTNFFGKGLSFLLLPLFSNPKYLSTADNGLLSLFSQAAIFIFPFINLSILQSASVGYFKKDTKAFKDFFTTGFFMSACMCLLSFLILFTCKNFIFTTFSFPLLFIWAIPLAAFLTFCYELVIILLRNADDAEQYMKINVTRIVAELGLATILIIFLSCHWLGRVASILVSLGCVAIYALFFFIRNGYLSGSVKKEIIYAEIKYSVPVIAVQLSIFFLFSSDSFLLSAITKDNSLVGIYGMACVFASIIITLSGALSQYMIPKINKALAAESIDYTGIKKQFKIYGSIMVCTFLAMLVAVPAVYHLFINYRYWPGISYFYLISTGYFFWTITVFFYTFLLFYKKKLLLFLIAFAATGISFCSNYFFIKSMGSHGASISVCCSYFIVMVIVIVATKKYWKPLLYL